MSGRVRCSWPLPATSRPLPPCGCVRPPRIPIQRIQRASSQSSGKSKKVDAPKQKKVRNMFRYPDMKQVEKYALVDAMRYLQAFEVGRAPSAKYELAVKIKTPKNGPVIRNRFRPPHPISTSVRICVICPPDSAQAKAAKEAGAVLTGEDEIFEQIKAGTINFEKCICYSESLAKMSKAGLGRILGPKGLMPSAKTGTVTKDVAKTVRDMTGSSEYRERTGVVRLAIGQLGFTPEQLQNNIKTFMESLKSDCAKLSDRFSKDVFEVVLSSTGGPGFTLSGEYRRPDSIDPSELSA